MAWLYIIGAGTSSRDLWNVTSCVLDLWQNANMIIGEFKKRYEGVVSKETVVLRRWGSSIQKVGFINGVDNVNWPPYRDSKS